MHYQQEPMAIVGFACRLPGGNTTPHKLWRFLEQGEVASNQVPGSRFNVKGHYDGSNKPGTMRPPGGMFLEGIDLARFDAEFFQVSGVEAIAMDPNQRQMLEVVVEGLENAGLTLEKVDNAPVACFVASYASDYGDMHCRDPEDRPANCPIGIGRAIMANRISYCLNIKGPSITIDTACSGSLVGIDLACRVIQSGEVDAAIVAASNLYLNPEHVMDAGSVGQAHSPSGLCHTFDASADGYVKAEAVNCVIIKRLTDAIRDRDPIRAIIRGSASTSNGRTSGIASPNWEAQAAAIRTAYANAGISDMTETAYLECHGTGTQAGDFAEVMGVGAVFAPGRPAEKPLIIGSIKSNVGHSEPAAGMSGLIKTVLALETGVIPGTPLFKTPNPSIDFAGNRVLPCRTRQSWPDSKFPRRASINSFGFGGSNAHAIIERPSAELRHGHVCSYASTADKVLLGSNEENKNKTRPQLLVLGGNDALTLEHNVKALCDYLVDPRVTVSLSDLAYTLSERRSRLWHSAFAVTTNRELGDKDFTIGKKASEEPRVAFVFTGQGAQWPQMGKMLLEHFPFTRTLLEDLDRVLQRTPNPPSWSLIAELTDPRPEQQLRRPDVSQPLLTAIQICIVTILEVWGVKPTSVVGHSSGEIAAACTAGLLDRHSAIKAAFYRGQAAMSNGTGTRDDFGMLAVGLSYDDVVPFLAGFDGRLHIACFNSPKSLTIAGSRPELENLSNQITAKGHFSKLLQVDVAYHSPYVRSIGEKYLSLLDLDGGFSPWSSTGSGIRMLSTVTVTSITTTPDSTYWKANMLSPVRFQEALQALISQEKPPDILIEIGPSGTLRGPISQILESVPLSRSISYYSSLSRGENASTSLYHLAGHLYNAGSPIRLPQVNAYNETARVVVDLPNYQWNHSIRYWHESSASLNWRFKHFPAHDLIGSKTLSSSWNSPTWRRRLVLQDVSWLRDHRMGSDILMPGAGFVAMALEAMFQKYYVQEPGRVLSPNELCYRFKNVRFERALLVEERTEITIALSLSPVTDDKAWHEFRVSTLDSAIETRHCIGLICVHDALTEVLHGKVMEPLVLPSPAEVWYRSQKRIGMCFGPAFQMVQSIESTAGSRSCRSLVSLVPPKSTYEPQSYYPFHPAVLDSMLQTATPANACGHCSDIKEVMVPSEVEEIIINKVPLNVQQGMSLATSDYSGRGRRNAAKNWVANITIADSKTGAILLKVKKLRYTRLDVIEAPDPHSFSCVSWKPDIFTLRPMQELLLAEQTDNYTLGSILTFFSHKTPTLRVLEIGLDQGDSYSVWFQDGDFAPQNAYSEYAYATSNVEQLVNIEDKNRWREKSSFLVANIEQSGLGLGTTQKYDLIIMKGLQKIGSQIEIVLKNLRTLFADNASLLVVLSEELSLPSRNGESVLLARDNPVKRLDDRKTLHFLLEKTQMTSDIREFQSPTDGGSVSLCLWADPMDCAKRLDNKNRHINIVRFSDSVLNLAADIETRLRRDGWSVEHSVAAIARGQVPQTITLVLDEMVYPLLRHADTRQWAMIKSVLNSDVTLLWVTKGAQVSVFNPDHALVHGLFRVVRREELSAKLTTLDISSASNFVAGQAISQVALEIHYNRAETEYAELKGRLHISRVMPDTAMNTFKRLKGSADPVQQNLFGIQTRVQLLSQRVGTLEMAWHETDPGQAPELEETWIEVAIEAIGVNFKDVATAMGLVPENEHALGCECAGTIKRLGIGVRKFALGDRVVVLRNATFANVCRAPEKRAHAIPTWMSFEDASTIPVAYVTAFYSLFTIGNLQEGQTVLIHSAAGGVGLAAIQLAQHKKALIFATVSTDEKRRYLIEVIGIPSDQVFSSRNIDFAEKILQATHRRGVNLILNSLTGELLHASWNICADGGIMVEIGKKDIINHQQLSMDPFDRSCTFRAVDLSHVQVISDIVIENLLKQVFDLVEIGHITPLRPVAYFSFNSIVDALIQLRSGKHIGKIVISKLGNTEINVSIKPATRALKLRPSASYLIVGGLRGLCGSLAVHMARHGARHIIVFNRSTSRHPRAAKVIQDCEAYNCRITEAQGDITNFESVIQVVNSAKPPISGIIQGAMVLQDKIFESMTQEDYQTVIKPKVQGTWNIHQAFQESENSYLDFFTMLSSVSGVVGNKGQANYASANTFLDAFANYRIRLGLPANSINLGIVQDIGYVAEKGEVLEERFDKTIWTPLSERILRQTLGYSIMQQEPDQPINIDSRAQLITGISYPLRGTDLDVFKESRFAHLKNHHESSDSLAIEDVNESDRELNQATKAFSLLHASGHDLISLHAACVKFLSLQISRVLRLEAKIEPSRPLTAYGLDSLSAVELRGWIRLRLGVELSTLDIMNASSILTLSDKLIAKVSIVTKSVA